MGDVYKSKGSLNFLFFYNGCWQICSSLIANINELFKPILEPCAGKSVLLHASLQSFDINLVIFVENISFFENTGHISNVFLHLTLFLLKFGKKSVTFVKASSWLRVVNRLGTSRSLTPESVSSLWRRVVKVFIALVFIGFLVHSLHHIKLVGFILIHCVVLVISIHVLHFVHHFGHVHILFFFRKFHHHLHHFNKFRIFLAILIPEEVFHHVVFISAVIISKKVFHHFHHLLLVVHVTVLVFLHDILHHFHHFKFIHFVVFHHVEHIHFVVETVHLGVH